MISIMRTRSIPVWMQITGILIVICAGIIVTTGEYVRRMEQEFLHETIEANKKRIANSVASSAIEAIIVEDISILNTIISQLVASNSDIQSMTITNEEKVTLAQWSGTQEVDKNKLLTHSEEISYDGEVFGYMTITWNIDKKLAHIERHIDTIYLFTSLIMLVFTGIGIILIHWLVSRPLNNISKRLLDHSKGVSAAGPELSTSREFKQIYTAINKIEALTISKEELEREVQHRKSIQDELAIAKDKALEASHAKSAFLANMSHEIRTPLTAIIGFSETLLESGQSMSDRLDTIRTLIRSSKHLQTIINDILDLSKIEAGKLEIERRDSDLFGIVRDVFEIASKQAFGKNLICKVDYVFPLPEKIHTDPIRLKQILINLLGNAIKFTQEGSVRIRVSATPENNMITFKVIDTGIGMTIEQKDRLFASFSQADVSITRNYGGTGLGLHLSKQLAEMLDGDISVDSAKDVGSCFTLNIDGGESGYWKLLTDKPVDADTSSGEKQLHSRFAGEILLVEDNPDNQTLLTYMIRKNGPNVTLAENGKVALEKVNTREFDLILMDMQMPVMGGLEATRVLRDKGYQGGIVALTANALSEDREKCIEAGCNEFLTKPIDRKRLEQVLSHYMQPIESDSFHDGPERIVSSLLEEDGDFAMLVKKFVDQIPDMIAEMKQSYSEENWEKLRWVTHDFKSTSGNYGFGIISEIAAQLEFEIIKRDRQNIEQLFSKLDFLKERIVYTEPNPVSKVSGS